MLFFGPPGYYRRSNYPRNDWITVRYTLGDSQVSHSLSTHQSFAFKEQHGKTQPLR